MPLSIRFCLIVLLLVNCAVVAQQPADDILLADPTIFEEEGIYYLISTGSGYCYYDGVGSLDLRFIPNPHNPEVAHMEPCWYSELRESEE